MKLLNIVFLFIFIACSGDGGSNGIQNESGAIKNNPPQELKLESIKVPAREGDQNFFAKDLLIHGEDIVLTFDKVLNPNSIIGTPANDATVIVTGGGEEIHMISIIEGNKLTLKLSYGMSFLPETEYSIKLVTGQSGIKGINNEILSLNDYDRSFKFLTEDALPSDVLRLQFDLKHTTSRVNELQSLLDDPNTGYVDQVIVIKEEEDLNNSQVTTTRIELNYYEIAPNLVSAPIDEQKTHYLDIQGNYTAGLSYKFRILACITSLKVVGDSGDTHCSQSGYISFTP